MNTRGSGFGGRGSDRSPLRVPSPEPRTPDRLPRQVKLFGWVSLLNDFASEMIYPLLPAFVTGVLGGGPQALGALDGAAEFAAAVVKLGAGRLADRTSRRGPLIVLGYLIAVVVRPVIAVTGAAWQVIGLRVVDRLGKGLRTPPRDALIADATPADLVGRAFGLQRGMDHAGAVLGPILAGWRLASGRGGPRQTMWLGWLAYAILAVGMARAGTAAAAWGWFLGLGLVAGLTESPERSLVARLAGAQQGSGFGVYHGVTGFAALVGGVALGAVFQRYGAGPAFLASAAGGLGLVLGWPVLARAGVWRWRGVR